jgi:hypothetical protein
MDRLSVNLAISRGKRLYHNLPFVVFALDLRDPLGLHLAQLLHGLGDARHPEDIQRRAERRARAPVVVVPSSLEHLSRVVESLMATAERGETEGRTSGDVSAMRFFARGARGVHDGVAVFIAADDERSVFCFPLQRHKGPKEPVRPMDPIRFEQVFGQVGGDMAASSNDLDALDEPEQGDDFKIDDE